MSAVGDARLHAVDDVQYSLPHLPQAVSTARKIAAEVLGGWRVDDNVSEVVVLVVSELVTNAVEHAQPPVALHLMRDFHCAQLRVEVVDGGPAVHDKWPVSSEADEHGRGLSIVGAVTTAHGTVFHAHGATHWASLPSTA
ncbi:ATP-binding protein [Streptomyces chartreusis]|uniref:ATP-binding protein n=1 Tax=Streptomyces chartreusis TaxID=1969 RepID=UPI0037FAC4D6